MSSERQDTPSQRNHWIVARPRPEPLATEPGVSVIVPCRNEAGTIAEIVERVPEMGAGTQLVFVEGGSTDGTREEIERQIELRPDRRISVFGQTGRCKRTPSESASSRHPVRC